MIDKIGLAILKNDFQGAIDLILSPRPSQYQDLRWNQFKTSLGKYNLRGGERRVGNNGFCQTVLGCPMSITDWWCTVKFLNQCEGLSWWSMLVRRTQKRRLTHWATGSRDLLRGNCCLAWQTLIKTTRFFIQFRIFHRTKLFFLLYLLQREKNT